MNDHKDVLASLKRAFKVWHPGDFGDAQAQMANLIEQAALFYVAELLDGADLSLHVSLDEPPQVTAWFSDTEAPELRDTTLQLAKSSLTELVAGALDDLDLEELELSAKDIVDAVNRGIELAKIRGRLEG